MRKLTRPAPSRWRAFARDEDGVAAIEMSFIAPVMLAMFGLVVACQNTLSSWRAVNRTAHEVTDLVSRSPFVYDVNYTGAEDLAQANLDADLALAQLTMYPKSMTGLAFVLSQVQVNAGGATGKVVWSEGWNGGVPLACKSTVALDPQFAITQASYLLVGTASYTFQPLGVTLSLSPMTLSSTEILEVRNAQEIIVPEIQCP